MPASVLIIDSDAGVINAFVKTLGRHGFLVLVASSASQGLEILRNRRPHVLILDIQGSAPAGVELLREVKALYPSLPIIAMTAYSTSFTETDAIREGADGYFAKPFDLDALVEKLQAVAQKASSKTRMSVTTKPGG